jgi:hypothetical protein
MEVRNVTRKLGKVPQAETNTGERVSDPVEWPARVSPI